MTMLINVLTIPFMVLVSVIIATLKRFWDRG